MNKSHVSMEHHICIVCGCKYPTDAILLDKRLRESLPVDAVTGFGICPDDKAKLADGYIALVEVRKRPDWARSEMRPEEGDRTGKLAWLTRDAFRAVFNASDIAPDGRAYPMVWVEEGVIDKLAETVGIPVNDNDNTNDN